MFRALDQLCEQPDWMEQTHWQLC